MRFLRRGQLVLLGGLVACGGVQPDESVEMTVLIGGLRALNANVGQSRHGVFTTRPGTLSNDVFMNLLDMNTKWQKSATSEGVLEGHDRATDEPRWTGTVVDLVFGSNAQLRAIAEVYASIDAEPAFACAVSVYALGIE